MIRQITRKISASTNERLQRGMENTLTATQYFQLRKNIINYILAEIYQKMES